LGDLVCFGSMILFALYLAFGRANRDFPNVWLYMWPVYMAAGVCCLSIAVFVTDFQAQPFDAREGLLLVGLGVVPTVIGHGSINYALKHLRGQAVGVANLSQVLFAGLLAYLLLGEVPELAFYPAGALIALGVFLAFKKRGAASA
jgi:drug/metabolite transporter (DMT)-like permease